MLKCKSLVNLVGKINTQCVYKLHMPGSDKLCIVIISWGKRDFIIEKQIAQHFVQFS